ncbi:exosome component 10 isoform X2 [Maniola jurtina]|uniref:exosome component 10 isoform X2 n=1 Tax=Maniola jurtina TaxID=191418 RepID=UPI001E68AD42|nr:exosome component 10 isoform X2 [Maniola jurtina]
MQSTAAGFLPPEVMASIQKGFVTMNKTIKLSNNLPVGGAYKQCSSVTDFDVVAQRFSHNVVFQLNSIFMTELASYKLKGDDFEYNMERLVDANDSILDRVYNNIDCVNKGVEPNRPTDNAVIGPGGYYRPKITKIQVGDTTFTAARNITRPQLFFKDQIDNTSAVWVPKIKEKPNNTKPLALERIYDEDGRHIGFEHPYRIELDQFTPRPEWLTYDNEEPAMPPAVTETNFTFVSDEKQLDELVKHLLTVEELGVDLEHHSYRSYQGFTCLVQLTTTAGDFIIDAIACREYLYKLNEVFTNPNILKIFHGSDCDILWLQKDFGLYVLGIFDTYRAAQVLNFSIKSLAALLKRYCGVDADKTHQMADWRLRPLTPELITYARTDTHFLPYICKKMRADLIRAGNGDPHLLEKVFKRSQEVSGRTYTKPAVDQNSHLKLYQNSRPFNAQQMEALKRLYLWRDEEARRMDESTSYLLPNHMLLSLAEVLPRDTQGVTALCQPMPPFVRQNVEKICQILMSCRQVHLDDGFGARFTAARLEPPAPEYAVHDLPHEEDEDDRVDVALNGNGALHRRMDCYYQAPPSVFMPYYFVPPFVRHSNYRIIAQPALLRRNAEVRVQEVQEALTAASSNVAGPSATPPQAQYRQNNNKKWHNKKKT